MKFSFKRILTSALAAVMTASVLSVGMISSVSAASTIYNFAEITSSYAVSNYGSTITTLSTSADENLDLFGDGVVTVNGKLKPAVINYPNGKKPEYLSTAATEGTLKGTVFTQAVVSTSGGNGSNKFVDVKVKEGDILEVYYFGADSGGATGKTSASVSITGAELVNTPALSGDSKIADYVKANVTKAGTVSITPASGRMGIAAIVLTPAGDITYTDGIVTYNTPENGTVTVMNGESPVASGTKVTGGTQLTLTAAPDQGYAASVTVNDNPVTLGADNTHKFTVNGNVTINVEFNKVYERSPINSSVTFDIRDQETHKLVCKYGEKATNDFYFELTNGATISDYIRISTANSDGSNNSVKFTIGDKPAKMYITFKSASSNSERTIRVADTKTNTLVYNGKANNTGAGTADEVTNDTAIDLAAGTEYYIATESSNMNLYKIVITVEGSEKIADTLTKTNNSDDYYAHSNADTYIIHPVSQDDMLSSSLSIQGTDVSTNIVYDAIDFGDGSSISTSDVEGAFKLFAVVAKDTQGAAPTKALTWVLDN